MIQDMQLRGFSARTQECYVAAVRQLAEHHHSSPDQLHEEDLRQYFLYLAKEKKVARATATIALCGIKFFYEQTLQRQWPTLRLIRPPREKKLPVVLSRQEVRRALGAVRIPVYRACLTTIYACGLRLLEGAHLQVPDVDSGRLLLHIHGKRKKDRYVPLPEPTLQMLRAFWRTHRSPVWLFPAPTRHGLAHSLAHHRGPGTRTSLQSAFHRSPRGLDGGSGGHLPPPRRRVSRTLRGSLAAQSTAGAAGYRSVPYGVLRRPFEKVRSLRPQGLHLSLLPQWQLPEVSPRPDRTLAPKTARAPAALPVFPGDRYLAL
jgi:integrase